MMEIMVDSMNQGLIETAELNRMAGFPIYTLDVAGVAIFLSAGSRVASVFRPALCGAAITILLRTLFHY